MNFKAGLQSGIPLCCISYHTFIYNSIFHLKLKNNRKLLDLYIDLKNAIDRYNNCGASCYVKCPKCLLKGEYFALLKDDRESGENCHNTNWEKAISKYMTRKRVK